MPARIHVVLFLVLFSTSWSGGISASPARGLDDDPLFFDAPADPGPDTIIPDGEAVAAPASLPPAERAPLGTVFLFGEAAPAAGLEPIWIGPWNLEHGWQGHADRLADQRAGGGTPVVQFYYWGDDISPACLESGCWSDRHDAWKDQAGWNAVADGLVRMLHDAIAGADVVVVIETEFNKNGTSRYEPLDGLLAAMATRIQTGYPGARTVLGLGNWDPGAWSTFDRAAQAVDMIGIQAMRGSTRHGPATYVDAFDTTLARAHIARSLFGKPLLVHDLALSSYPDDDTADRQADALQRFLDGVPRLRDAGVQGIVYRAWTDDVDAPDGHFGPAERHWGLTDHAGAWKPAAHVWARGVMGSASSSG